MGIFLLLDKSQTLRASDLARELGVSRNAVSLQLKNLRQKDFIFMTENKNINLSEKGLRVSKITSSKKETMKIFFKEVLGLSDKVSEQDSAKLEHLLSDEAGMALLKLVKFIRSDTKVTLEFLKEFQAVEIKCDMEIGCGLCDNIETKKGSFSH